jgi:uncharacterized delta-60 repeat protein
MKSYNTLFVCLFAICCLLSTILHAQVDTAWTRIYTGPGDHDDYARAIAVDDSGNVFVTGRSFGLSTNDDYATIKYNSHGVELWAQRYTGPGNYSNEANAIAVDGQGNVYVTGHIYDSGTLHDHATIKYNSSGDTLWVRIYNGTGNGSDWPKAIAVDGQGNVYVTGSSYGSGTDDDYATIKYNSSGDTLWVRTYNGPGNGGDGANAIAVDGQGNVYVTGGSYSGVETSDDYATIKYNSAGDTVWVSRYNGPGNFWDRAYAIAVDGQGNVYVTGYSSGSGTDFDYATIKYNSAGIEQWVQRYNGPGYNWDWPKAIAVDGQGNVHVTGYIATVSVSPYNHDYLTIKYNSAGDTLWVRRYNGPGNYIDRAYAIALDSSGNVYVTGWSYGSGTMDDYLTIKYNPVGVQQWVARYNGPGIFWDDATAIALDGSGNVYVTGYSENVSGTGADYLTIKYVQTGAIEENEIASLPLAKTSGVEIFPNPAKNYFTIRLPEMLKQVQGDNCVIEIFDVSGKEILNQVQNDNTVRVSLEGIKNGVYFVKINNNHQVTKLIVTK